MINQYSPEYEKETVILAQIDLTTGSIPKTLLRFAFPMICGNLLQQLYNVADTLIVGRFLGSDALGAVGSSYTLMTFLTSILLGLCMGSGALFSVCWGQRDLARLRRQTHAAFVLIAVCTVVLNAAAFLLLDAMKTLLSVPAEVWPLMRSYLFVIFLGIGGTFLYNYYASLLRAVGNSLVPLLFLAASAVLNIALDLVFVLVCRWGVEGAAAATVLAQWLSGIGTAVYTLVRCPELRARREERRITGSMLRELLSASVLTCLQQSVMNLGILMVQGRINSFGPVIMAAFAAAVKIDSFAYMPLQDFGNAFSTFIAQNYGAQRPERIRRGIRTAVLLSSVFAVCVSACVVLLAAPLLGLFLQPGETEILQAGVTYLRIAGAFYVGIGGLFTAVGDCRFNAPYLKTLYDYLDLPNKMYKGSLTTEKRSDRQYTVEFLDVSFRYPGSEQYALRHLSMTFKVGERLAVVGMNGSGKTTFIKLLCRLYDPTEGVILLNGIDIRKYRYDEYMDIFSVVFQDFKLFSLPLGQNVATAQHYDAARAADCLQKAGFSDRLARMPKGLDTCLYKDLDEDGVTISGGEAQKIAIARALYKDAPFIVLDEPTAALDPVAEAEIYAKFNEIAGDKTAIYISHRLSSCKFCDEIAVFDHGEVVQQGTHEELLGEPDGKYYELWNAQAQYYTEESA